MENREKLLTFDSKDEEFFSYWLEELEEYIWSWEAHPAPFKLFDGLVIKQEVQLRTKTKIVSKTLLQSHVYTPDFTILTKINENYFDRLFTKIAGRVYIEIKPKFDKYNMTRLFHLNQKWVYDKYGIFVNQVVVDTLFKQTFVPKKCAFNLNGTRSKRFEKCKLK